MFLPKSEVFKDLRQEAINEISEVAVEETYEEGSTLFAVGSPANNFYMLVQGSVQVTIGENSRKKYVVSNLGETFGWSSLVGNDFYTAKAHCLTPTKVLKIDKSELEKVFDAHERSGRTFFRTLARQLGQRLIDMHS
ncbi:Crp/Fnr family transcriptional regulator [Thermodesulfobacteriota bacterium]